MAFCKENSPIDLGLKVLRLAKQTTDKIAFKINFSCTQGWCVTLTAFVYSFSVIKAFGILVNFQLKILQVQMQVEPNQQCIEMS